MCVTICCYWYSIDAVPFSLASVNPLTTRSLRARCDVRQAVLGFWKLTPLTILPPENITNPQCDAAVVLTRLTCPVIVPCDPPEACQGNNTVCTALGGGGDCSSTVSRARLLPRLPGRYVHTPLSPGHGRLDPRAKCCVVHLAFTPSVLARGSELLWAPFFHELLCRARLRCCRRGSAPPSTRASGARCARRGTTV